MKTLKVGTFPGTLKEIVIEDTATVKDALKIAGISVESDQEIKFDGVITDLNSSVANGTLLIVTKRLKGN